MSDKFSLDDDSTIIGYLNQANRVMQIYDSEKEDFNCWLNRFEYAADLISIPKYQMGKVFLKMVNNNVRERIQIINPAINLSKLPYQKIIAHYLRVFSPNEDYLHRGRFKCRKQYKEESIERYADRLRKIYNMCYYKSDQEEEICAQFINGILDEDIRNKLSKIPKLSFKKTVTKAIEFSKYDVMEYYVNQAHLEINTYNPKTGVPFHAWLNKFEYVADTIGVKDDKMITFFNRMVDIDFQASIKVFFGSKLYNMSYSELIDSYLRFSLRNEIDLHRPRFLCCKQYEQESIEEYANRLVNIYNKCCKIYQSVPEEELCVQFIKGIRDNLNKSFLCFTRGLTFNDTVKKAIEVSKMDLTKYMVDQALTMINIYNPENRVDFNDWLNQFEYVADFLGIQESEMVTFFKNMVDNKLQMRVEEESPAVSFSEISYKEIRDLYGEVIFKSNIISSYRNRFKCRYQFPRETVEKYAKNLEEIYYECGYVTCFDERLCKQFLKGLRNTEMKCYLSKYRKLSFYNAIKIAIEFESQKETFEK